MKTDINRLLHAGFWFGKTPLQEALDLASMGVGGFCIYGGTKQEVRRFTQAVQAVSPLKRLLICADYEDGLGRWISDTELLPSNMAIGAANDESLSFEKGLLTARQARALGVNWVLAPVVDLADNPLNPIVNTRSFAQAPSRVIPLARAFMKGLQKGGVLNSLKHFPGHGDTQTDSHLGLPVLPLTLKNLQEKELLSFTPLLPLADSVMVGHLFLPHIDKNYPASLSDKIISDLLKKELGYTGCVVTDALLMKALGDEKEAALRAFLSGAHILLAPEKPFELLEFLHKQNLPEEKVKLAIRQQEVLCNKIPTDLPEETDPFSPQTLSQRTAEKALCQKGEIPLLKEGQKVKIKEIGREEESDCGLFVKTLENHGIKIVSEQAEADVLIILCWRRYQAFRGSIGLEEKEREQTDKALKQTKKSVAVYFANPWIAQHIKTKGCIFTFSPTAPFQKQAALCLLNKAACNGNFPVELSF